MLFSPLQVLSLWGRGLVAVLILLVSLYCWREWYDRSQVRTDTGVREDRRTDPNATYDFQPSLGLNVPTVFFAVGLLTGAWSLGGGLAAARLRRRRGPTADNRQLTRDRHGQAKLIHREDDNSLFTEAEGPVDAPVLLLTHGWGGTSAEWNPLRPYLAEAPYRVLRWDLPGLGRSESPADRDFSLQRMAEDLKLVIDGSAPSGRQLVLVGHSIGAMVCLEFARRYPDVVRERVAGMLLAHGTFTNPLRTHAKADLYTAIQKPVIEPLLWLSIPLDPVLRVLKWLAYLNGSTHRSTERSGFSGHETRNQLDFAARFALRAAVATIARGSLGMLHWDATDVLPHVPCPTLIWAGENDPTTLPQASQDLYTRIPRSELHSQKGAKHLSPIEYPAEFAQRLLEFAETCLRDRVPKAHVLITPPPPAARPVRAPGAEVPESTKTEPDRAAEVGSARETTTPGREA
jgi:pimeloyl-ACP methyl ester carboxylesterase